MRIKLFEDFIGGVNYDITISSKIKERVGELSKLTPYVLELGGDPPLNVSEALGGKVHVVDSKGNIIRIFNTIDKFLEGCGRPIKI